LTGEAKLGCLKPLVLLIWEYLLGHVLSCLSRPSAKLFLYLMSELGDFINEVSRLCVLGLVGGGHGHLLRLLFDTLFSIASRT